MKRKIRNILIGLCILSVFIGAIIFLIYFSQEQSPINSSDTPDPTKYMYFSVKYVIDPRCGRLIGDSEQTIKYGDDATPITVSPYLGYKFLGWSDENSLDEAKELSFTREDKNVRDFILVEAKFDGPIKFTLRFNVENEKGGRIEGETRQIVPYNGNSEKIVAVPEQNFRFVKWSDGETNPVREFKNMQEYPFELLGPGAHYITAIFEKFQLESKYNYNGATANNTEESVKFTINEIEGKKLIVPQRENCIFDGWYSDWHLTTQVSDAAGNVIVGNEWLQRDGIYDEYNPEGQLYAKWKAINKIPKYKILMVFITEVHGDFVAGSFLRPETLRNIRVDYVMSETERKVCEQLAEYFERYLNAILNAEVNFEIDTFFTTQPVNENNFDRGQGQNSNICYYMLSRNSIPEIKDILDNYGSVLTGFCLGGMENKYALTGNTAGAGMKKFACICLDNCFGTVPIEEQLNLTLDDSYIHLEYSMELYAHEFIHTIEERLASLHVIAEDYLKKHDGNVSGLWEFVPVIKALQGGYIVVDDSIGYPGLNGENLAIPKEFWIENDFS